MERTMKLLIFGILGFSLIFIVIGIISFYSLFKVENEVSIEMVAFSSLTAEESELIPISPKDSIVRQVPVNDDIKALMDKDYAKDQVYSVTFNHTMIDTKGNLVVYIGLDKKTVLGKGFMMLD